MRKTFLILVVLLLSSCATKYNPPTDMTNVATINYEVNVDAALGYTSSLYIKKAHSNNSCYSDGELVAFINGGNPFGGSTKNPKNVPFKVMEKSFFCVNIAPANVGGQRGCEKLISFVAKPSNSYKIVATWGNYSCSTHILNLSKDVPVEYDEENL